MTNFEKARDAESDEIFDGLQATIWENGADWSRQWTLENEVKDLVEVLIKNREMLKNRYCSGGIPDYLKNEYYDLRDIGKDVIAKYQEAVDE